MQHNIAYLLPSLSCGCAASACFAASCLGCTYMMRIRTFQHCCCASLYVQHVQLPVPLLLLASC